MCRALGGFVLEPGAHAVGVDLFQRDDQQRAQDARQRLVALAGPAALGLELSASLDTVSDGQARCARLQFAARARQGRACQASSAGVAMRSDSRFASSSALGLAAAMRSRFSWRGSIPWSIIVCSRRASSRAARVSTLGCRRWSRGPSAGSAWIPLPHRLAEAPPQFIGDRHDLQRLYWSAMRW
jgi:hypothetical protein